MRRSVIEELLRVHYAVPQVFKPRPVRPEGFVAFAVNHFPGKSFRRSNATRWWYFETALLKSLHSQNRCDAYQTVMEIRHREGPNDP
jgi:hypothetical protein